jgi:hypothetical protein
MSFVVVAGGQSGKVASSPDGINWTLQSSVMGATTVAGSAYSPELGLFVIVGAAKIAYSSNGAAWTLASSPVVSGGLLKVAWSPLLGLFVAVGSLSQTVTSPDGINWTLHSLVGSVTNFCITWSPDLGIFAMGGSAGGMFTSPDGFSWTSQSTGFGSSDIRGVTWGGGLFLAVGAAGTTSHSPDGSTWTVFSPTGPLDTVVFNDTKFAPSLNEFIIIPGSAGKIVTTPDGVTLTEHVAFTGSASSGWAAYLGLWIVVGNTGQLYTSPDGTTWTPRVSSFGTSFLQTVVSSSPIIPRGLKSQQGYVIA